MLCRICHKHGLNKEDRDEKEFVEMAKKMTTRMTKLINDKWNLSVQAVENDTWQEVTTVK